MSDELLPCPCSMCVNGPVSIHDPSMFLGGYIVECGNCQTSGPRCSSKEGAIKAWNLLNQNHAPDLARVTAERDELEKSVITWRAEAQINKEEEERYKRWTEDLRAKVAELEKELCAIKELRKFKANLTEEIVYLNKQLTSRDQIIAEKDKVLGVLNSYVETDKCECPPLESQLEPCSRCMILEMIDESVNGTEVA